MVRVERCVRDEIYARSGINLNTFVDPDSRQLSECVHCGYNVCLDLR